mgnify:FL=1
MADTLDTDPPADLGPGDGADPVSDGPGRRRRIAPLIVAGVGAVLVALFVMLVAAEPDPGESAETPLLDQPAPDAVGAFADGTSFELSQRKGSWVVLNFFTHNCVPCIREHDDLVAFVDQQRSLGLDGAEFYSIVQGSTPEQVEEFFAERGGDWPVVYDPDLDFQLGFGVVRVPETWIIDPGGIVRGRLITEVEADFLSSNLQLLRERFG